MEIDYRSVPINRTLGMEVLSREDGAVCLRYPVLSSFHNPFGQLQGGMYAVFLDTAMAMAGRALTVSLNVSLLQPAKGSWVTVTGQVIRRGSRIIFAEGEVRDEDGTVLARATQTCVPREAAPKVPEG